MADTTHTPGPWVIYPETDGSEICAVDMVARLPIRQIICRPVRGHHWIANARLIAAAPDLLEGSEGLLALIRGLLDDPTRLEEFAAVKTARKAIAKAKGEST